MKIELQKTVDALDKAINELKNLVKQDQEAGNDMNMKVKSVKYNWRQVGSTVDRDGAGDDWERFTVGENGVTSIEEHEPHNELQQWNYVVRMENGSSCRIFNPNFVEYFPV
jgi:hypothetical protein